MNTPGGFAEYISRVRSFSRNAWLFIVHIVGMDVIYGTWQVLFNLYLLAVFANGVSFDVFGQHFQMTALQLIGYRILVAGIAGSVAAIPAGMLSDRIGRKFSFITGDYVGAMMGLINITTLNPVILLITPLFESSSSTLHGVSEPAFMAENSEPQERVHLFSVAASIRTLAALGGALLGGFAPGLLSPDKIEAYRTATFIGIGGWCLSLIPALLLKEKYTLAAPKTGERKRGLFASVVHRERIARLVVCDALIALGAAFVVPLFNVFFHSGLHASDSEIGITFAGGSLFLAIGALVAPIVVGRLGKVPAIVSLRMIAIPFVMMLAFSPDIQQITHLGSHLTIAGFAFIARTTFMNMANPVASAFAMEILSPQERGTAVGITAALGNLMFALAGFVGVQYFNSGDFRTPFVFMAVLFTISVTLYWRFFGRPLPAAEPALAVAGE